MTVAQLEAAVARLGFAPSIDDGGELLRDAAERAIAEILAVRPRIGRLILRHLPETPLLSVTSPKEIRGEKTFSLPEGGSFYLESVGDGLLTVSRGTHQKTYPLRVGTRGGVTVTVGAIPTSEGAVTLRVVGGVGFYLPVLAVYASPYVSTAPPTSPFGTSDYDLAALAPDFAGLVGAPRLADGTPLCEGEEGDYTLEGSVLHLAPRRACEIRLSYRRRLPLTMEGKIPLCDEEAALLPLFCAAYVFLDDDPDKAAFYLARFREGLSAILPPREAVTAFRDVTGWG